jgi:hypothetical protein
MPFTNSSVAKDQLGGVPWLVPQARWWQEFLEVERG